MLCKPRIYTSMSEVFPASVFGGHTAEEFIDAVCKISRADITNAEASHLHEELYGWVQARTKHMGELVSSAYCQGALIGSLLVPAVYGCRADCGSLRKVESELNQGVNRLELLPQVSLNDHKTIACIGRTATVARDTANGSCEFFDTTKPSRFEAAYLEFLTTELPERAVTRSPLALCAITGTYFMIGAHTYYRGFQQMEDSSRDKGQREIAAAVDKALDASELYVMDVDDFNKGIAGILYR